MNKLSLYLHFPFCKNKCNYCDFYSLPRQELIPAYQYKLAKSFPAFAALANDSIVETVYLGGGTPSLATPEGVAEIFSFLRESFCVSQGAEITVEMNPESTGEAILAAYAKAGVNRISFGMQSACDKELAALGRLHRFESVERAVSLARDMGFKNISLDLMYGLPEQTLESFRESLNRAASLAPKHISFYLLTLSSKAPLNRMAHLLPDDDTVREMYLTASDFLQKKGFEHYEISNAAQKGYRSRHNLVYWTGGDYLGIGPGAHSLLNGKRFHMENGVEEFLSAANPLDRLCQTEILTRKDLFTEYVMLSLRTKEGISLKRVCDLSDEKTASSIRDKFLLWQKYGLCIPTEEGFALSVEGFFVSNEIITELL